VMARDGLAHSIAGEFIKASATDFIYP